MLKYNFGRHFMPQTKDERIAELEAENADLRDACRQKQEIIDGNKGLAGDYLRLREALEALLNDPLSAMAQGVAAAALEQGDE